MNYIYGANAKELDQAYTDILKCAGLEDFKQGKADDATRILLSGLSLILTEIRNI